MLEAASELSGHDLHTMCITHRKRWATCLTERRSWEKNVTPIDSVKFTVLVTH
jgi:hypothetical protein